MDQHRSPAGVLEGWGFAHLVVVYFVDRGCCPSVVLQGALWDHGVTGKAMQSPIPEQQSERCPYPGPPFCLWWSWSASKGYLPFCDLTETSKRGAWSGQVEPLYHVEWYQQDGISSGTDAALVCWGEVGTLYAFRSVWKTVFKGLLPIGLTSNPCWGILLINNAAKPPNIPWLELRHHM